MKSSNTYTLKEAFNEFLKSIDHKNRVNELRIKDSWEKLMGKSTVIHTRDIYLIRNVLFVCITSPALREEMAYSKTKIIDMLNKDLQANVVKDIVFK